MRASLPLLENSDFPPIRRDRLHTVQVNVGYLCNQSCTHCHVSAGPQRTERMSAATAAEVIKFLHTARVDTLDITGGAPEMNLNFRRLVDTAHKLGLRVIDRCNLTILSQPGYEDLAEFLAERGVEVVASLPCYLEENVDQQRGKGVYRDSIAGLEKLNALGYGRPGTGLILDLVFNPLGPVLPPPQIELEMTYKSALKERFGVVFNRLLTLANLPVGRFGSVLQSKGQFADYIDLLRGAHRKENLSAVMCRGLISVDWEGFVYDCDFNQMLSLPLIVGEAARTHISELTDTALVGLPITVRNHCYGCTAGQGSSCGGALAESFKTQGLVA